MSAKFCLVRDVTIVKHHHLRFCRLRDNGAVKVEHILVEIEQQIQLRPSKTALLSHVYNVDMYMYIINNTVHLNQ